LKNKTLDCVECDIPPGLKDFNTCGTCSYKDEKKEKSVKRSLRKKNERKGKK
jgi:hypothetical protein